ncbi:MAG: LysR family transcriptional regulator [gamma proteobacterium endosymbiont of Lamellibrachia anaximandri]|nr:LysR family transcriptional regulator [gamma proteobacterium endosymbiont of Lamellibrachia anaximandri]MBL3533865.1 LysR family transcriptional regulator [gamma proteobacterium endosymbiont of Lamellibrachia anaximandri]MBL3601328.1 LysR family transcriptional regulator [gamma proteobacterium endosymbiont of Lamellibrachia anaximandri]
MASTPQVYYKQNRLKQLRAFCHAAQTGSISEAAERIYLSQPTVSLQIQALEREFDTVLFERRGPKIKLTSEGEILYKLAQPLVEGMDKLRETFSAACGKLESGELNIAAGESTILYILPEPLRRFAERFPGIRLKLHNVTGRDGMTMLRADEADFAIGSMLEVPDDVTYEPIVNYGPALITPLGHPLADKSRVTLKDISPYGLILPPHHLSTWRMVDLVFEQHNASYKVTLEAGGWEVIKRYVENGMGISIVTDLCLTGDEKVVKIPLGEYFPDRSYGIVLRRGKFISPQSKRFLEIMREVFGGKRGLDAGSG